MYLLQLLERPIEDLSITISSVNPDSPATHSIALPRFRAFQIVTVRLTLA